MTLSHFAFGEALIPQQLRILCHMMLAYYEII